MNQSPQDGAPTRVRRNLTITACGLVTVILLTFALTRKRGGDDPAAARPATSTAIDALPTLATQILPEIATGADTSGWETEELAAAADAALNKLAPLLTSGQPIAATDLTALIDTSFAGYPKWLTNIDINRKIEGTALKRRDADFGDRSQGLSSATEMLESWRMTLDPGAEILFKVIDVRPARDGLTVAMRLYFETRSPGLRQQVGLFDSTWTRRGDALALSALKPESFSEAESDTASPWFTDASGSVFAGVESYDKQVAFGLQHWLRRVERSFGMLYFKRHGLTVGDADGDGLDDVYLCQAGGLPNRLYLQNSDGSVRDVGESSGTDFLDNTASALLLDLDNDGDQDLALATFEGVVLLENDGGARFSLASHLPMHDRDLHGLSAADFDLDGDLDLYVLVDFAEKQARRAEPLPSFVYHDANDGGANLLLRNDSDAAGNWSFSDVTAEVGLDTHNRRHSLAASWEDYDRDGDPDLYVANDYGQNCLYRNDGGKFEEIASEVGLVDHGSGMSVSWGDFNRDGFADIYVGNMFSAAGRRIMAQAQFLPGSGGERRSLYQRFAKGNSLFAGSADGSFTEVANAAGAEIGRWAWGSPFVDLNNDGHQDIVVANGYITTADSGDL